MTDIIETKEGIMMARRIVFGAVVLLAGWTIAAFGWSEEGTLHVATSKPDEGAVFSVGDNVQVEFRIWAENTSKRKDGTPKKMKVKWATSQPSYSHDGEEILDKTMEYTIDNVSAGHYISSITATPRKLNNALMQEKTATASRSWFVGSFGGKIVPANDFAGRSYARVGVGEWGDLQVTLRQGVALDDLTPLTWTRTAGTAITIISADPNEGTAKFIAGDSSGDVELKLTDKNNNSVTLTVAVVCPTSIVIKKEPDTTVWHIKGKASVGFMGGVFVAPADVSFVGIRICERECKGEGTGIYKDDETPHKAGGWIYMSPREYTIDGHKVTGVDYIKNEPRDPPFKEGGTFQWLIPIDYQVHSYEGGFSGALQSKRLTIVRHLEQVTSKGTATISKGGHSETKTLNEKTTMDGWPSIPGR